MYRKGRLKKLILAIFAAISWAFHALAYSQGSAATTTAVFDVGLASIKFNYPNAYTLKPGSLEGETKWTACVVAPNGELSIEAFSFGYCPEQLKEEGFKSPEEYVLKEIGDENVERAKFDGYDRLISRTSSSVTVVFLRHEAEWGECFQQLTFTFAKDASAKVRGTITQVIESVQPSFDARRWD